jgi:hypothetical protein
MDLELSENKFKETTDEEFQKTLMNILDLSTKDNTYKFAFMRFLLDYCNEHAETHVEFQTIASYFFKYYWLQECKSKFKQAPQVEKKPEIIKIIQKEFDKPFYPQTFAKISKEEPKKIQNCVKEIVKRGFHNVTWRFQRVKAGTGVEEKKIFFDYTILRVKNENRKYIDLDAGIDINPKAMEFFKKYNTLLKKAVNLEWARFLEKLNLGVPRLIQKTEGEIIPRTALGKYRKALETHFKNCYYCNNPLVKNQTHVEHVIPFDYIAEDNIWNFTLACQKCNCTKLGSLPPEKFLDELINRNKNYRNKIPMLDKSLTLLGVNYEKIIRDHFENAKSHGYQILERFP